MPKNVFLPPLAGLLATLLAMLAPIAAADDALPPGFANLVEQVRTRFEIPGLAIAVVKDGKVVLASGYGERQLGGKAVNDRTRFAIASNTKAFTAAALAILVDDGKINWDTPLVEYLPDFALSDPYVTAHITPRDLLAHNSGLPLGAGDLLWWPRTTYSNDEVLHRLRYLPLERSFRQGYAYDNVLYGVAGKLVATVSGMSFEKFVDKRILKPLGMRDSLMQYPGSAKRGNVARPHANFGHPLREIDAFESDKTNAAGGLQVSARDMAKWLNMHLSGGLNEKNEQVVSKAQVSNLHSVVTPMPLGKPPCDIDALQVQFRAYALGLSVEDYRGHKIIRHGGGLPGYVSEVLMVPGHNLGIAVMTNQQVRAGITVLVSTLLDYYLGVDTPDWLPVIEQCHQQRIAKYLAAVESVHAERQEGTAALPAQRLAQRYRDRWYGDVEVRLLENGQLEMEFMHTPDLIGDMEHWHYNTWIVRWRNAPLPPNDIFVTFALDAPGEVISASMQPVSPFTDFSYDFTHLKLVPLKLYK